MIINKLKAGDKSYLAFFRRYRHKYFRRIEHRLLYKFNLVL